MRRPKEKVCANCDVYSREPHTPADCVRYLRARIEQAKAILRLARAEANGWTPTCVRTLDALDYGD